MGNNSLKRRVRRRLRGAASSAFLALIVLSLLWRTETALSDEAPKSRDFGAETIIGAGALPVDQVEEKLVETPPSAAPPEDVKEGVPDAGPLPENERLLNDRTTVLNVTDGEISALIKTFSKLTKRNYIVDSAVKGKVTIHFPTEVTVGEALRIFESVLLLKGFTTVPVAENVWKVIPAKDARQTTIPTVKNGAEAPSDALVTELVRLKYIPAEEVQQLINQFVSRDGLITAVASTNSLVIIDSSANIRRLKGLVSQLDVPALDQEITIIPIYYANAAEVAEKINEILGNADSKKGGQDTASALQAPVQPQRPMAIPGQQLGQSKGVESVGRRALPLKIIPDERTNSVIVVADREMTLKVRALTEQLDSKVDLSGVGFFVYRLKHADAEQLAEILSSLVGSGGGISSSRSTGTTGSSISRSRSSDRGRYGLGGGFGDYGRGRYDDTQSRMASALQRSRDLLSQRQGAGGTGAGGTTGGSSSGGGRVNLEGDVSIAADTATNSLIINASRSDYDKLRQVIEALDIKRHQVLVEATLLEVSMSKTEGMGVELQGTAAWDNGGVMGQTNFSNLTNLLSNPSALSDLTIAAASTGTVTLPGGIVIPSQAVLITALSRHQNANVLSSPTILATDNEEAEIIVGENVPFVSSTSTNQTNLNNTFNQVERQDVGITLRITPQISTGDFVTLHIFVEISNVVPTTRNDPNGPTTTIRTTETQVEVKSGQMVVTGGLLQDRITDAVRGVPFLSDIPVLGQLFQRQDNSVDRTNLLVFITPRIVSDQYEARETTRAYAGQLDSYIKEEGIEPRRGEVLKSRRMDSVVEQLPHDPAGQHPTTITPPAADSASSPGDNEEARQAAARTAARLEALEPAAAQQQQLSAPSKDEVIDVTVAPRLPAPGAAPAARAPQDRSTLENGDTPANETYVVLRETRATGGARPMPFAYADTEKTVALIVLGDLNSDTGRFFAVGRRYRFALEGVQREFVCLGVYGAQDEAALVHPSLRSRAMWHTLTPEESLLLGKKGWLRG